MNLARSLYTRYIYIKSIVFLYTSNKQNKVKKIPFIKASKYVKYLGINFTKGHKAFTLYTILLANTTIMSYNHYFLCVCGENV